MKPPSPKQKIRYIGELAEKAKMPRIGEALAEVYDNVIRNAVNHSDYVLHEGKMHLLKDHRFSQKEKCYTPVITFDELEQVISNAFAFYRAVFALYDRCRASFIDFKDAFLPYDAHYKGVLELLFDDKLTLIGFRVYWPNSSYSQYTRSSDGCGGQNLVFDPDGSINMMGACTQKSVARFHR
jgi:hypothetical protein